MKNLFYLLFIVLTAYSCSDEIGESTSDSDKKTETRAVYAPSTISTKVEAHKAIAYAVSKLMNSDPSFQSYVIQNMTKESMRRSSTSNSSTGTAVGDGQGGGSTGPIRLKDLLIFHVTSDPVRKTKMNEILKELPVFVNVVDPVRAVLDLDPLVAINVPVDLVPSCDLLSIKLNDTEVEFPTIVRDYAEDDEFNFFAGELDIELIDEHGTCGYYISTSIYDILINPTDLTICGGTSLPSLVGKEMSNCPDVLEAIRSKSFFPISPSCVLVDLYTDVFSKFRINCEPKMPQTNPPTTGPRSKIGCPRAGMDLVNSSNLNYIKSITNISLATFFYMDNQPCFGPEDLFMHNLVRNSSYLQAHEFNKDLTIGMTRAEMLNPGKSHGKKRRVWKGLKGWVTFWDQVSPTASNVSDLGLWIEMPFVYPIPVQRYMFRDNTPSYSNWVPESQGDFMDIAWHELDEKTCVSNNNTSQSHSIGGNVMFGSSYKIPAGPGFQGSAGVNWNKSGSNATSYTINAPAEVKLGVFEISYCATPNGTFDYENIGPSYEFESTTGGILTSIMTTVQINNK